MNKPFIAAAVFAVAAACALPAQALVLTSVTLNDNVDHGVRIEAPDTLWVDLGLRNYRPVTASFRIEPGDPSLFSFSSVLENLAGALWGSITWSLGGGASFAAVPGTPSGFGSVAAAFGSIASVVVNPPAEPTSQRIEFTLDGEPFGLSTGNPLLLAGLSDWQIDVSRVPTGNEFTLTVAAMPIPVPGAALLLGSGLLGLCGLFGLMRRQAGTPA